MERSSRLNEWLTLVANIAGSSESSLRECRHRWLSGLTAEVDLLMLDWGNVLDRLEEAVVVEPPDPLEGGKLDILETAPRPSPSHDFRLE